MKLKRKYFSAVKNQKMMRNRRNHTAYLNCRAFAMMLLLSSTTQGLTLPGRRVGDLWIRIQENQPSLIGLGCGRARRPLTQRHSIESRELRFYKSDYSQTHRRYYTSQRQQSFFSSNEPNAFSLSRSSLRVAAIADGLALLSKSAFISSSAWDHRGAYHLTTSTAHHGRIGMGPQIHLSDQEAELFELLNQAVKMMGLGCTLRVAGGWVRDKLLATEEFQRSHNKISTTPDTSVVQRLTSKYKGPSAGRKGTKLIGVSKAASEDITIPFLSLVNNQSQQPVDIDIALDNMLGREFAEKFNAWLSMNGRETHSVGVVLQNPEKSKHLETATMQVGSFWVDFVNLRAEEYTSNSRIPDLMRIGTAEEDAYRRDLTINALFYNICTGQVEDWTGRGLQDLKRGIISTPLPPLTTLLDDPLRVLRSIRFAARLRFAMDDGLKEAATNENVRLALEQKVSRERIGSEVDLMLRSQDPVGAMRLMVNLNFMGIVFPIHAFHLKSGTFKNEHNLPKRLFDCGLNLLTTTHDHLCSCKVNTPMWCEKKRALAAATHGVTEAPLIEDEESRRKLWYAAFLKPIMNHAKSMEKELEATLHRHQGKKANRSPIMMLMVDELKRPVRDGEAVELIMKAADEFTELLEGGSALSASAVILGKVHVNYTNIGSESTVSCFMASKKVNVETEKDPVWLHAMDFRIAASRIMTKVGHLWRAALILSLCEQLADSDRNRYSYTIEGDVVRYEFPIDVVVDFYALNFCCLHIF